MAGVFCECDISQKILSLMVVNVLQTGRQGERRWSIAIIGSDDIKSIITIIIIKIYLLEAII